MAQPTRPCPLARALGLAALLGLLPALCGGARAGEAQDGLWKALCAALPAEQLAEVRFLAHLGWRLERDPAVKEVTVQGGHPCRHESLAAAHRAGALRIRIPRRARPAALRAFGARARALSDGVPSRCAYKFRIKRAVDRAVRRLERLTEAGRYKFPDLLFGAFDSPWFVIDMPKPRWTRQGPIWVGVGSARRSMEAFFRRGASAECYAGQALAVYTIQYELYGPTAFDRAFTGEDLTLGRPLDIKQTPIGRFTSYDAHFPYRALLIRLCNQKKDPVFPLAAQGPLAFVGLSGIVRNQVSDVHSNENWILTSISKRAMDDLVRGGGLRYFSQLTKQVWEAYAPGRGLFVLPGRKRAAKRAADAALAKPVFQEIRVYVHPYGNVPLGEIVKKKLEQVDTPVELVFYLHGREDGLYQRYRKAFLSGWLDAPARRPLTAVSGSG